MSAVEIQEEAEVTKNCTKYHFAYRLLIGKFQIAHTKYYYKLTVIFIEQPY